MPWWPSVPHRMSSFLRKSLRTGSISQYVVSKESSSSPSSCTCLPLSTRKTELIKWPLLNTALDQRRVQRSTGTCAKPGQQQMLPHGRDVLILVLCVLPTHSSTSSADIYLVFPWALVSRALHIFFSLLMWLLRMRQVTHRGPGCICSDEFC